MKLFLSLLICSLWFNSATGAEAPNRTTPLDRVISTIEKLSHAHNTKSVGFSNAAAAELRKLNPMELGKLAAVARILAYEVDVGSNSLSAFYDDLFWLAANELARTATPESTRALEFVRRFSDLQSGALLRFNEIVERESSP